MYDAMGVRRETGDQGKALNDLFQLFEDMGKPISPEKKFKELVGHTPCRWSAARSSASPWAVRSCRSDVQDHKQFNRHEPSRPGRLFAKIGA